MPAENVLEDCRKSLEDNLNEDDSFVNEFDEAFNVDIDEYNDWLSRELWEIENVERDNEEKVHDEVPIVDVKVESNVNDDSMSKQMIGGGSSANEVDKDFAMDTSRMVTLLQVIFTMLLIAGKSLHEQSVQIARLSQLPQPSVSSSMQPVVLSSRSQCSCLTKSRAYCKVITALRGKVADMASIGKVWYRHFCTVFSTVMDVVIVFATCNYE